MRTPPRVMPALITPFDGEGELDLEAHRHNLSVLRERGIEGFLLGGSTGEGPYLEPGERRVLVEASRDELGEEAFLLCGVMGESVRLAVAQTREAAAGGADAALVLTPTALVRGKDDEVVGFFRRVIAAAPLPVLLYSVPRWTGYELPVDAIVELAGHSDAAGIKDSGGNPVRVEQVAAVAPETFRVFAGSSAAAALSVTAGAHGMITASTNYAPTLVRDVVAAARKSPRKALELQERLTGLSRLVESRGIPGVKLAAEVSGLRPGFPRAPLRPLPEADAEKLERSLAAMRRQVLG